VDDVARDCRDCGVVEENGVLAPSAARINSSCRFFPPTAIADGDRTAVVFVDQISDEDEFSSHDSVLLA